MTVAVNPSANTGVVDVAEQAVSAVSLVALAASHAKLAEILRMRGARGQQEEQKRDALHGRHPAQALVEKDGHGALVPHLLSRHRP
jgi:hypothetical protein